VRFLLLTSEPADVELGSGTAMAVEQLRDALGGIGVEVPLIRADQHRRSATVGRWRFNHHLDAARLNDYDAVLGVNGDGWAMAGDLVVPFVALIKALYADALQHERGVTRALLGAHARWEGEGARRADLVVTPSAYAAEMVVKHYSVAPARVHTLAEPFDAESWRARLPQRPRNGNRVLCVAHLYPRKRIADLIDAWPMVQTRRPDARLDIIGDGPELRHLVRRAAGLHTCYLHGHVGHPDILEFYARADVFCLPSAQETFGYAAVEAMASGLPLVLADTGALAEVANGAVAEHVRAGDAHELAGALMRSLDASVRARAAELNQRRAAMFAPHVFAANLLALVADARSALGQRRAGGSVSRSAGSRR
jgi:phosphatidyl-myo-inositol dimannoside synthase